MASAQITERVIPSVLIAGFTLVIAALVGGGVVAIKNLDSIRDSAAELVRSQTMLTRLVDEIQREQENLNAVYYTLGRHPDQVDRVHVLQQIQEVESEIGRVVKTASQQGDSAVWNDLWIASRAFTEEARRLLSAPLHTKLKSEDLLRRHEKVISLVARLIDLSHAKSRAARQSIESQAAKLLRESAMFLGAGVILALLCAALTVRMTTDLFRKVEWQAGELSRVSWHMLENQEAAARRFSHELHDELGQTLTAIRTNLLTLKPQSHSERLEDCLELVDQAIRNVREMSQLLRPTVLDDFGLDPSLRMLAEKFAQRTGIEVHYDSTFTGRLADETETHLYRIAQEALTNVARHSGARDVWIELTQKRDKIFLNIRDNGRGLNYSSSTGGLGLIGMRARARSAGGELEVQRVNGSGVDIRVWVPARRADA